MIRRATAADLPAIEALVEAAYGPWVERIGKRPGPMSTDYAAALEDAEASVYESAGEVVGLLILVAEPGALLIKNVAVAPTRQGEGIGRELMAHAEAEARARGLGSLRLYTHELMVENIAFYGRIGYEEYERRAESGFARTFMRKLL